MQASGKQTDEQIEFLNPPELMDPRQHGYSHVALVPACRRLVLLAGQSAHTVDGALPDGFGAQCASVARNIEVALAAVGAPPASVCKVVVLAVDYDAEKL